MRSSLLFLSTDAKILDLIRKGDEEALVVLYESNRRPVTAYVTRNRGTVDDANDMLQEALVVLWERVRTGKFEYRAQLSTFIYATVKNMWSQHLRRQRRESTAGIDPDGQEDESPSILENLIAGDEAAIVRDALERIGDQCRRLLMLFYWEEMSMDEIASQLGFANADTAKAKKYQCKKALERLLVAQ